MESRCASPGLTPAATTGPLEEQQAAREALRITGQRRTVEIRLQLLAGVGWSSLPALPLMRQPTLILAGNDDPMIPLGNGRIMRALLAKASLHVFDDGHLGLLTAADDLGQLVSRFLTFP